MTPLPLGEINTLLVAELVKGFMVLEIFSEPVGVSFCARSENVSTGL